MQVARLFKRHGTYLFRPFEPLVLRDCVILMFVNSIQKVVRWKNVKLISTCFYRKLVINFQGSKAKGTSRGIYLKILTCRKKCWKIQLQRQLLRICHPFFRPPFFFNVQLFFAPEQLSTIDVLVNNNNYFSVLFRPLVNSVEDENFQSTSVFCQVALKNVIRVLQCT